MKKGIRSNLSVKRISTSPYFSPDFEKLEKDIIKKLTNADMLASNDEKIASILITNTHTDTKKIRKEQIEACELLIHPNSGYDNLSVEFIKSAKFPIIIGNPIRAMAVSNYILSALINHYSSLPIETLWSEKRKWPRKLLSELNILVLGKGHIGSILSQSLTPLVSNISFFDPFEGFHELNLKNIDVVILACSLNNENRHIINNHFLDQLNDNFLLINAARGGLVKTDDLIKTLTLKPKAYAVLDVFEKEPADFSLFSSLKNIKHTSHIAGVYQNIDLITAQFEAQVIHDFITFDESDFLSAYKKTNLKNRLSANQDFLI